MSRWCTIADVADSKATLRSRIRARRRQRPDDHAAGRVATGLLATARAAGLLAPEGRPDEVGPGPIAAYIAAAGEPDLAELCSAVRQSGGSVLLPIPGPRGVLTWAWDDGRYEPHDELPVAMPSGPVIGTGGDVLLAHHATVLLLPALAVDLAGGRLGQGGGYYDRLLARLAVTEHRVLTVAVVHDDEVLAADTIPREPHDQLVAAVLTPTRFLRVDG